MSNDDPVVVHKDLAFSNEVEFLKLNFGKFVRSSKKLNFWKIFRREAAVAGFWQGTRVMQGALEGSALKILRWILCVIRYLSRRAIPQA